MFCPQCGSQQSDEMRFCKNCGSNLQLVRQAVTYREANDQFDWSRTWVAEMFMSQGERKRREEELRRQRGITPEIRRYYEIKGGVITGSIGLAVMPLLYLLMHGIILSGNVTSGAAEILSRIWIAGLVPLMIGLALIINGVFVSKKIVEAYDRQAQDPLSPTGSANDRLDSPAPDTTKFMPGSPSVTEDETLHLRESPQERSRRSK